MIAPPIFTSPQSVRAVGGGGGGGATSTATTKRYVPVEDGFITTAGNKERGSKYGNATGAHPLTTAHVTAGVPAGFGGQKIG
jgi:hypothetical protein